MKAYLEPEEISLIEKATTNLRDKLLVRLLFHLGCRISEALSLTIDDIDFIKSTVMIIHLKQRVKISCSDCGTRLSRSHAFCPSCGDKIEKSQIEEQRHRRQRVLPIDHDTLKLLEEYVARGGPVLKDGKQLIFGINRHRAWQIVRDCAEKVGLPKLINSETGKLHNVSPHKFRDAFAIHAIKLNDSGDGLRMLQEHLGHQSFRSSDGKTVVLTNCALTEGQRVKFKVVAETKNVNFGEVVELTPDYLYQVIKQEILVRIRGSLNTVRKVSSRVKQITVKIYSPT